VFQGDPVISAAGRIEIEFIGAYDRACHVEAAR
jgi:hypothetical protein